MTNHTPTPWFTKQAHLNYGAWVLMHHVDGGTKRVDMNKGGGFSEQDAAHIVRCVNSHDELVSALERLVETERDASVGPTECRRALEGAERALAAAKGR